jgi:transposase
VLVGAPGRRIPPNTYMNTKQTSRTGRKPVIDTTPNPTQKVSCIKLSLDVHADKLKVARQLGDLPQQPVQTFWAKEFVNFASKQLEQAEKVHCCYEAGPTGFWLHRELVEAGIDNIVVVPEVLDVLGRKVNNDRNDARRLGLRHNRYVAGDREALAPVWVPSLEQEQRRALVRQRGQFGKVLRSLASMGRSICLLHGYRLRGAWWRQCGWEDAQIPPWLREHLARFRPTMAEAEKQIRQLTNQLRASAPKTLPKGLGPLTYEVLEAEVVDWQRFRNRKHPGSFVGLCGGVSASGQTHADLSITKYGHARLRAVLIELAWRWVMYQPQCPLVQRWKHVLLNPHSHVRRRKQAIVAVARQLFVDLWRWRTGRLTPEQLGWKMVTKN